MVASALLYNYQGRHCGSQGPPTAHLPSLPDFLHLRKLLYINPTVQHSSLYLDAVRRPFITRENVRIITAALRLLVVRVVDAEMTTDARWLATHDGIHYT